MFVQTASAAFGPGLDIIKTVWSGRFRTNVSFSYGSRRLFSLSAMICEESHRVIGEMSTLVTLLSPEVRWFIPTAQTSSLLMHRRATLWTNGFSEESCGTHRFPYAETSPSNQQKLRV